MKELQGLGLRVDLVEDGEGIDAEALIAEAGPADKSVPAIALADDDEEVETVLDEADDIGEITDEDGMSIQDIDEIEVTTEEEA